MGVLRVTASLTVLLRGTWTVYALRSAAFYGERRAHVDVVIFSPALDGRLRQQFSTAGIPVIPVCVYAQPPTTKTTSPLLRLWSRFVPGSPRLYETARVLVSFITFPLFGRGTALAIRGPAI